MKVESLGLQSGPCSNQHWLTPVTEAPTPLTCGPCLVLTPERGMHLVCACLIQPSPLTWVICSPQTHFLRHGPGQLPGPLQCLEVALTGPWGILAFGCSRRPRLRLSGDICMKAVLPRCPSWWKTLSGVHCWVYEVSWGWGGVGGRAWKYREARAASVLGSGCTAGWLSPHLWEPRCHHL